MLVASAVPAAPVFLVVKLQTFVDEWLRITLVRLFFFFGVSQPVAMQVSTLDGCPPRAVGVTFEALKKRKSCREEIRMTARKHFATGFPQQLITAG